MRILMYAPVPDHRADGVSAHRRRLAAQLSASGDVIETATRRSSVVGRQYDIAHLHYVPFLYGGWGVEVLGTLRQLKQLGRVVVTIHEARVPYAWRPRNIFLATLQAVILKEIVALADRLILTTNQLRRFIGDAPAAVIPAGSPLAPEDRPGGRRGERFIVGIIGSAHEGRMQSLAVEACRQVAAQLGGEAICIGETQAEGLFSTGFLPEADFSRKLAELDLLILPYSDGVSGRRTTIAAACQLAVPTVTTVTQPQLDFPDTAAWACTNPRDPALFIQTALDVANNDEWRVRLGFTSRMLFDQCLSWEILANSTRAVYEGALS